MGIIVGNRRLLDISKRFLVDYFSDGEIRQPEDFDKDILGVDCFPAFMEIIGGRQPAWNKTIFCDALGELVEEGEILAWQDDVRGWMYKSKI